MNLENYATITQTQAHEKTGARYEMVPTKLMIDILADHGWLPSKILESRSNIYHGFQKHIVRFRNESQLPVQVGEYVPELVLFNSHMGSSAFKLMSGVFRLICTNGLVTGDTFDSQTVRHTGFAVEKAERAIKLITDQMPRTIEGVEKMRAVNLNDSERMALAESALELVKDPEGKYSINPKSLISPWRYQDARDTSLWSTFNVIQENVIKGGVRRVDSLGRRNRTRAVQDVKKNIDLNRALWTLAEKMAELKAA